MRVTLNVQRLHCAWEIKLDIERGTTHRERAIWAAEEEHRYRTALEAIDAAPEHASEIAQRVLGMGQLDMGD